MVWVHVHALRACAYARLMFNVYVYMFAERCDLNGVNHAEANAFAAEPGCVGITFIIFFFLSFR